MKYDAENINPLGYHLLIEMKEVEEKTEGGILLTSGAQNREQAAMNVGKVLKIGPLAYKNHQSGANTAEDWGFSIGDWVQFPSHVYMRVAGKKSNLVLVLDYDIKAKVIQP